MHNLLNFTTFGLFIWCVIAGNHRTADGLEESNFKNSRDQQSPDVSPDRRNAHLSEWSSRFQKNREPLDAPLSDNGHSQDGAPKKPEAPPSQDKAPQNDQKPPDGDAPKNKDHSFTDVLYNTDVDKAEMKKDYEVPMGIKLKDDCSDEVIYTFKDTRMKDIAEHFEAKCNTANKKQIQMKLIKEFADNVLQKIGQVMLILQVQNKDNKNVLAETVTWMKLFTKPSKQEKLTFERPKYEIESLVEYTGVLEQFKAKMVNDWNAIIKYSIIYIDNDIKDSVTIDSFTGALRIIKSLQPGHYSMKLQAQTGDQKYKDTTDVILNISNMAVCNTKDLNFIHSLMVVQIPQGKVVQEVVNPNKQQEGCNYKMVSQKPAEGYFSLNQKTGLLSLKKQVLRSDPIFGGNKKEPKFHLELEIQCNSKSKRSTTDPPEKGSPKEEKAQIDNTLSVLNNPKKLLVEVLIDDDEPLVFAQDEFYVGYPQAYDFIEESLPSPLATVQVDRKNLKNEADIRYEIEEKDCPFSIHPTSGNIYPWTYHKESDKLTFTVVAKRMDKVKVIGEAKTKVMVFFLTLKEIVQIDLTGVDISNIDSPLQNLKIESDFILKELSHAVLPHRAVQSKEAAKENSETVKHLMRIYCYGLDTKQHTVVDGDVILEKVKSSLNVVDIDVVYRDSSKTPGKSDHRFWPSGLFICIVVILVIFGAFGTYLFYERKRAFPFGLMRNRHHDHTSATPLEDDMEGPSRTRWINSAANPFSKFNNTHSNARPSFSDFRTPNVAFSFHAADGTLEGSNYSDLPFPQYGNLSSFKPEVREDRDTPLNSINLQSEPTYSTLTPPETSTSTEAQNNNVPILPVVMLPPVCIDRNRRNRQVSTEARNDDTNGAGKSS